VHQDASPGASVQDAEKSGKGKGQDAAVPVTAPEAAGVEVVNMKPEVEVVNMNQEVHAAKA
jgi:hypothetical protein